MNRRATDGRGLTQAHLDEVKTSVSEHWRAELAKEAGTLCAELAENQWLREQVAVLARDRDHWRSMYEQRERWIQQARGGRA